MAISKIENNSLASGVPSRSQLPAGTVLQVVQSVKSDTQSTTATSPQDVTGLSVTITPTSATSKILVMADVAWGFADSFDSSGYLYLLRGSTAIYVGDAAGSRGRVWAAPTNDIGQQQYAITRVPGIYLDSPATTNATTYKVQFNTNNGGSAIYINRNAAETDQPYFGRVASSLTVMEIAA